MSRFLLLRPPFEDFYDSRDRRFPYNLFIIASHLRSWGHKAEVADLSLSPPTTVPLPPVLRIEPRIPAPDPSYLSFPGPYRRFGLSNKNLASFFSACRTSSFPPDAILATSLAAAYRTTFFETVIAARTAFNIPLIAGGTDVLSDPEAYVSFFADKLPGTAPVILYDLYHPEPLKNIVSSLPDLQGIIYASRISGERPLNFQDSCPSLITEPVTDDLAVIAPLIERNVAAPFLNKISGRDLSALYRRASILFSSGCPFSCSFCGHSDHAYRGRIPFSVKEADAAIGELRLFHRLGFKSVCVEDDSFTADSKAASQLLASLEKAREIHFPGLRLEFPNGLNYQTLDNEMMRRLSAAGTTFLTVSLCSVDDRTLEQANRPARSGEFDTFAEELNTRTPAGPEIEAFVIGGLPGQSVADIVRSSAKLVSSGITLGYSPFYPVKGSVISKKYGLEALSAELYRSMSFTTLPGQLNRHDAIDLFRTYRMLSFFQKNGISLTVDSITDAVLNEVADHPLSLADGVVDQGYRITTGNRHHSRTLFSLLTAWHSLADRTNYLMVRNAVDREFHSLVPLSSSSASLQELTNLVENDVTISVVVPIRDRSDLFVATAESIAKQTMRDCEVIVIDDGSTETESERIRAIIGGEICRRHRVQYEKQTISGGPGHARNRGIELAKGSVIVFCDADDIMYPKRLETIRNHYVENPFSFVFINDETWNRNGRRINKPKEFLFSTFTEFLHRLTERCVIGPSMMSVRRRTLDFIGRSWGSIFPEEIPISEDFNFFWRLLTFVPFFFTTSTLTEKMGGDVRSVSTLFRKMITETKNVTKISFANKERESQIQIIKSYLLQNVKS